MRLLLQRLMLRAGPGLLAVGLVLGVCMASATAQVVANKAGDGLRAQARVKSRAPVWPWELTLDHIRRAMAASDYEIEQTRRVLDRADPRRLPTWIKVRELVRHAAETAQSEERYQLDMLGLENKALSEFELQLRKSRFANQSGFLFRYQSFRIADSERASENYAITFLGISTRIERPVYQIAVTSKVGARSAWFLEIETTTCYPLYRAEYDISGHLVGEIEVTSYDTTYDGSSLPQSVPSHSEKSYSTPTDAVAALNLPTKGVPESGALPPGYEPRSSKVVTDPLNGDKKAVLTYSDGIDQIFMTVAADPGLFRPAGHTVAVHQDAVGVTQCMFVHAGVQYVVVGRGADEPVRHVARVLYSQAVR